MAHQIDESKPKYLSQTRFMSGRRIIKTSVTEITDENVVDVLRKSLATHELNRSEIDYLWKYYRGDQPIRNRVKDVRPEICNKITENRANEIVSFKVGYLCGEPIQYVSRNGGEEIVKQINTLNEYMFAEDKAAQDQELVEWQMICGTAFRLVLPDEPGEEDEAPFELYTLDPRDTFVVYSNEIGNKPLMAVKYSKDDNEIFHYSIYTENRYYLVDGDILVESKPHDVLLKLFEQYVDDEHALWLLRKTVERSRVDVSYMSDEEYEHCLDKLFDSLLYQYMNPKLFTGEKFMGKHLNIGDQVAQTAGISYRIRIDNYVKIVRGVKFYAGYMDDSYAIHESKEFLQELLEDIIEIANELGITVNTRKTRICKLSEHWRFLQVQYSLTDTGRVIQKINPKRLTAMRRKMKKLAPKLTEKEFTDFYKSWFKNHYKIMSKKQRSNMDTLFNQLKEVTKCTLSPLPMAKS